METKIVGDCSQIPFICRKARVNRIVVALDERRGRVPLDQLLACRLQGIQVDDGVAFTEGLSGKLSVESLRPSFLIFSEGFRRSALIRKIKRGMDIAAALTGLILVVPLMLVIIPAIKIDSTGPVLYLQKRVGEGGKVFHLLKFRSMRVGAEGNGPVWAQVRDDRVTRVGRILRQLRLDEIPQMFNVLWGEMSFVGPRPERPFFVEKLAREIPFYAQRHSIKPGITGWAQIRYPYGASREDALEKLKFDLYYLKHMSPFFDLLIILKTIKIVLKGAGAR